MNRKTICAFLSKNHVNEFYPYLFSLSVVLELFLVDRISDLQPSLGNWESKAIQIANLQVPDDNFYGPGSALMLLPFLWVGGDFFEVNLFYCAIGSLFYWKITELIGNGVLRIVARVALPSNVYLIWLLHSSQDTVFEFSLLTISVYSLIKKNYILFLISTFLLSESRSQYWLYFLVAGLLLTLRYKKIKFTAPFVFLIFTSGFNLVHYASASPALEAGVTFELAYSRGYYLAHPKFDVDVFLDGPQGPLVSSSSSAPTNLTPAEENNYYLKVAKNEALSHPEETVLGFMQKLDSVFFITQKVPNLPGAYKLDTENQTIIIEADRINTYIVAGSLVQQVWRILFLTGGLVSVGIWIVLRKLKRVDFKELVWFLVPWASSAVSGILIYSETRFKIVSEMLLVPCIVLVLDKYQSYSKCNS